MRNHIGLARPWDWQILIMALSPKVPTNSAQSTRHCPFQNSGVLATSTIAPGMRTTIRRSLASCEKAFQGYLEAYTGYNRAGVAMRKKIRAKPADLTFTRAVCVSANFLSKLRTQAIRAKYLPRRGQPGIASVVVSHDDPYKGEEVRLKLHKLQRE